MRHRVSLASAARIALLLLLALFAGDNACAKDKPKDKDKDKEEPWLTEAELAQAFAVPAKARPFVPGEHLKFEAHWTVFLAAELETRVATIRPAGFGTLHQFVGTVRSRSVIDAIARIDSRVETRARPAPLTPVSFYENRKERGKRYHRYTFYDFQNGHGFWDNYESGDIKWLKFKRGRAFDLFTLFAHIRAQPWKTGTKRRYPLHVDGKYRIATIQCVTAERRAVGQWAEQPVVVLESEDLAKATTQKKGHLTFVLTDDPRHVPLEVLLRLSWGTVRIVLVEANGLVGAPLRPAP